MNDGSSQDPINVVHQIKVENLFIGHGSDKDQDDSSFNARVESLSLT